MSMARVPSFYQKMKMKKNGHMIKCLMTECGQVGQENLWLSVRTHVHPDLEPNIFPSGPPTQSISTYYPPIELLGPHLVGVAAY